jgi:hypothetical protein
VSRPWVANQCPRFAAWCFDRMTPVYPSRHIGLDFAHAASDTRGGCRDRAAVRALTVPPCVPGAFWRALLVTVAAGQHPDHRLQSAVDYDGSRPVCGHPDASASLEPTERRPVAFSQRNLR